MPRLKTSDSYLRAFLLAFAFGIFVISGCATKPPMTSPFGMPFYHTVARGETLWAISKAYGVSVENLMSANSIANASQIKSGSRLMIPKLGLKGTQAKKSSVSTLSTPGDWKYIVIHHSATPAGNAEIFDRDHRKRGFWNGLGYHFVICNGTSGRRDGEIQVGDRWVKQINGAHCNIGNMNEVGIGICLVGDFENGQRVSSRQMESLISLIRSLQKSYRVPSKNVVRHSDVKHTTECPGHNFPWRELQYSIVQNPVHMGLFAEQNDQPGTARSRSFYA